ncbi:DUF4974 domain-containing protein [Paucihalobacter ruber]|uniref:DUF4974 domain-containing protein n=1 Tax=Paucihalobacter ruber TaxID=2567861 RepID=A0A506PFH0_9FLAO|nr:FecR domain-containing protein [Paucihalobacter ruber]TPV31827.1 DUF4974 domain-containing protein [Paucihalobacter ruber]
MINKLIYKYLRFKTSEKETAQLFEWINKSEKNKQTFIKLKQSWAINSNYKYEAKELAKVKKAVGFKTAENYYQRTILKYAAVIILFLAIGGIVFNSIIKTQKPEINSFVTISLEDGKNIIIPENTINQVLNFNNSHKATLNDKKLEYSNKTTPNKYEMHTINVPFGKTFEVVLEDGTLVHLNSGSSLTYPSYFEEKSNREVLLTGEAYFEVKQDFGRPFLVKTTSVEILVTGTKFNISAYGDDKITQASLLEGSINVINENNRKKDTVNLSPGFGYKWDKENQSSTIIEILPSECISWMEGELVFKDTDFKNLITKLERNYNISIEINYPFLEDQKFTGKFKTNELSIADILKIISIDTDFTFEINGKKISINAPGL